MTISVLVEPAYSNFPEFSRTYGPEVGELCQLAGFAPDPEQQLILDAVFGVGKGGKSAAFEVAVIAARQNLKTGLLKQVALGKTVIMEQPLFMWSAHEFKTAQESFRDLAILIETCPDLDALVKRVYRGNGDESIEWKGGSRIIFKARTKSGARGLSGDCVGLDEAFAVLPAHMGALLPTLSARPDPQVLYASSAGLKHSEVLRGIRDRGRAGNDPRLAYFEWCAPDPSDVCALGDDCDHRLGVPGCGCDNPDLYQCANPALGRRISVDYISAERRALPPAEFGRERMGWWDELDSDVAIPMAGWVSCIDEGSSIVDKSMFVLDVAPMLTDAALVVAGERSDKSVHVEIVMREGQDRVDARPGVDWVVGALLDLKSRVPGFCVWIVSGGSAEALAGDIEAAGVSLKRFPARDLPAACGFFFGLVESNSLYHIGQSELDYSVSSAKWKNTGEGAQVWGRRKSGSGVTALYGASVSAFLVKRGAPLETANVFYV